MPDPTREDELRARFTEILSPAIDPRAPYAVQMINMLVSEALRLAASGGWRPSETIAFLDGLADLMDGWAKESPEGGWSTHQVQPNMKAADSCRREAARLKTLFPDPAGER